MKRALSAIFIFITFVSVLSSCGTPKNEDIFQKTSEEEIVKLPFGTKSTKKLKAYKDYIDEDIGAYGNYSVIYPIIDYSDNFAAVIAVNNDKTYENDGYNKISIFFLDKEKGQFANNGFDYVIEYADYKLYTSLEDDSFIVGAIRFDEAKNKYKRIDVNKIGNFEEEGILQNQFYNYKILYPKAYIKHTKRYSSSDETLFVYNEIDVTTGGGSVILETADGNISEICKIYSDAETKEKGNHRYYEPIGFADNTHILFNVYLDDECIGSDVYDTEEKAFIRFDGARKIIDVNEKSGIILKKDISTEEYSKFCESTLDGNETVICCYKNNKEKNTYVTYINGHFIKFNETTIEILSEDRKTVDSALARGNTKDTDIIISGDNVIIIRESWKN